MIWAKVREVLEESDVRISYPGLKDFPVGTVFHLTAGEDEAVRMHGASTGEGKESRVLSICLSFGPESRCRWH